MCRNIKRLRHPDHPPTDAELHDAALQFVRKISGFHHPSKANQASSDRAIQDVAAAGRVLFRSLHVRGHGVAAVLQALEAGGPRSTAMNTRKLVIGAVL